jgi:hypothetical protein
VPRPINRAACEARTREASADAIGGALSAITVEDAKGFFAHCGYPIEAHLPRGTMKSTEAAGQLAPKDTR